MGLTCTPGYYLINPVLTEQLCNRRATTYNQSAGVEQVMAGEVRGITEIRGMALQGKSHKVLSSKE